jgi:hypothetical protein
MKKTVCVDLDGVLARYDKWRGIDHFGEPIPGAVEFTKALAEIADVVIFTTRCNPEINRPEAVHLLVNRVRKFLDEHGFVYHDIYSGSGKPMAVAYVDDRAVVCRPEKDVENQDYDVALRMCRALVSGHSLGAQGTFSNGRINEEDEGDLKIMVGHHADCVRIDFGKPVGWIALPKDVAVSLGKAILTHAGEL